MKKIGLFFCALLAGCSLFQGKPLTFSQGNIIEDKQLTLLQPGMTKEDVTQIMGAPLLHHVFVKDHWDYLYRSTEGDKMLQEKHVALYFQKDRLVHIDVLPVSK